MHEHIENDFHRYQRLARATAVYPVVGSNFVYPTLGLVGEAGEVAEKIKKTIRDNDGIMTTEVRELISKELGDVLWYIANLASELSLQLDRIAEENILKLQRRLQEGTLHGEGDTR